jgi:hypothetical protein
MCINLLPNTAYFKKTLLSGVTLGTCAKIARVMPRPAGIKHFARTHTSTRLASRLQMWLRADVIPKTVDKPGILVDSHC